MVKEICICWQAGEGSLGKPTWSCLGESLGVEEGGSLSSPSWSSSGQALVSLLAAALGDPPRAGRGGRSHSWLSGSCSKQAAESGVGEERWWAHSGQIWANYPEQGWGKGSLSWLTQNCFGQAAESGREGRKAAGLAAAAGESGDHTRYGEKVWVEMG